MRESNDDVMNRGETIKTMTWRDEHLQDNDVTNADEQRRCDER